MTLANRLLLVEGPDDQHVVRNLWRQHANAELPLGQAITARYLDTHAAYAQKLVDWVKELYV